MGQHSITCLLAMALAIVTAGCTGQRTYNIADMGAVADGMTDNAAVINGAIARCHAKGGGKVLVPAGEYMTGTVYLRPGVCLELADSAKLTGSRDLSAYGSYVPSKDMSQYDSGVGSSNQNCVSDARWCRALIIAKDADGASITGNGTIDTGHLEDPDGEENMRGPHTIIIAESKGVAVKGISIARASNYAILAYDLEDAEFRDLTITEGWDGIHIRGALNTVIDNCDIRTGDDCIAGGYWDGFTISKCRLNSSCNGIRMIMPSGNLAIDGCTFYGPGEHPHRTSSSEGRPMLYAITLEPGGWGPAPGEMSGTVIRNCVAESVLSPLSVTLQEENSCKDILVENYMAHNCYRMALSVKSWGTARTENVTIRGCRFEFAGIDDHELPAKMEKLSFGQWPFFPSWGAYFRNVDNVAIENTVLTVSGTDYRQEIICDNVGNFTRE